jgi:hypothetical protein
MAGPPRLFEPLNVPLAGVGDMPFDLTGLGLQGYGAGGLSPMADLLAGYQQSTAPALQPAMPPLPGDPLLAGIAAAKAARAGEDKLTGLVKQGSSPALKAAAEKLAAERAAAEQAAQAGAGQAPTGPQTMTLGSSSSSRSGVVPNASMMTKGQAEESAGIKEQADIAADTAAGLDATAAERTDQLAAADSKAASIEQDYAADIETARRDRDAYVAKVQQTIDDAKQEVDPERWWGTRGTGQKIAVVAAAMLGGFTEGFTWGKVKNRALDMIDNAIARDVNAQEANIANARAQRGEMRGMVGILNAKLGDLETSKKGAIASEYEALARTFDVGAQNSKDVTYGKKMLSMAASLRERAGRHQQDLAVATGEKYSRTSGGHQVLVQPQGGGGTAGGKAQQKDRREFTEYAEQLRNTAGAFSDHNRAVAGMGAVWGVAGQYVPGIQTDPKVVEANRQRLAARIAKGEGVGQLAVDERKAWAQSLVSAGATKDARMRATMSGYNSAIRGARNKIQTAMELGYTEEANRIRRALGEVVELSRGDLRALVGK